MDIKLGVHKPGYVKCLYKEIHFLLEVTGITTELSVQLSGCTLENRRVRK